MSGFRCPCCSDRMKFFDTKSGLKRHLLLCHQTAFAVDPEGRDLVDKTTSLDGVALQQRLAQEIKNRGHKGRPVPVKRQAGATDKADVEVPATDNSGGLHEASYVMVQDPLLSQGAFNCPAAVNHMATTVSTCLPADITSSPDLSSGQDFSSIRPDWADFLNFEGSAIADQNNNEMGSFSPISPAVEEDSSSPPCSGEAPQLDVVKRLTDIIPLPNFIDMIQSIFCHNPHHSPEQVTERLMTWLKINQTDVIMKAYINNIVLCCALFERNFCASLAERFQSCNNPEMATNMVMAELSRVGQRPFSSAHDNTPPTSNE